MLDNFATGHRENLAPPARRRRADRGRHPELRARPQRGPRLRARLPPGRPALGAALDPGSAHQQRRRTSPGPLTSCSPPATRACGGSSSRPPPRSTGPTRELPKREDDGRRCPISPYAVAKLAAEGYCRAFHRGLRARDRRASLLQRLRAAPGPALAVRGGDPEVHHRLPRRRAARSSTATASSRVTSPTSTTRSRRTCWPATPRASRGLTFNVACGERITLNGLLDELRELTGSSIEAEYQPARPGDVPHSLADVSSAREHLSYEPLVGFREGLSRTFDYFRDLREIGSVANRS